MKILVTGAEGMLGKALCAALRSAEKAEEIYECGLDPADDRLAEYCRLADFVFDLAEIRNPAGTADYMRINYGFTLRLLEELKKCASTAPVMLASSAEAIATSRNYSHSEFGRSKLAVENILMEYARDTKVKTYIYRFPEIMGHTDAENDSEISALCRAYAGRKETAPVDDSLVKEVLYIDDLVKGLLELLDGKVDRCCYPAMGTAVAACDGRPGWSVQDKEKYFYDSSVIKYSGNAVYDGMTACINPSGPYCCIPLTYKVSLGKVRFLLERFGRVSDGCQIPDLIPESFERKLYDLYMSYLPSDMMRHDNRSDFGNELDSAELFGIENNKKVCAETVAPGQTLDIMHEYKTCSLLAVVSGQAHMRMENIVTGEILEYELDDRHSETIRMIPGWAVKIANTGSRKKLVLITVR